jgi:hypothetical protein
MSENTKAEDRPTTERLAAGAKVLGSLWRRKDRCKEGWRVSAGEVDGSWHSECACSPQSKFCTAKLRWVMLAIGEGREPEEGPFGLIQMMTVGELDALGTPVNVEITGVGPFRVGTGGNAAARDLIDLSKDAESAKHVLGLMKAFPGSKMSFQKEEAQKTVTP